MYRDYYALAMDIGRSGLKVAHGVPDAYEPEATYHYPATADRASNAGTPTPGVDPGIHVAVNGEPWVAGIDPAWMYSVMPLDKDRTSHPAYQAMVQAGLALPRRGHIPYVITGFPVSPCRHDEAGTYGVKGMIQGEHEIRGGARVVVDECLVVPQPVGAYTTVLREYGHIPEIRDRLRHGPITIVDVGYDTVDWSVIDRAGIAPRAGGTTTRALSTVLPEAANLISQEYARVGPASIGAALRSGRTSVLAGRYSVDLAPFLQQAADPVAQEVASLVAANLAWYSNAIGLMVLAGGGAPHFWPAFARRFPDSELLVPRNPATTITRGLWYHLAENVRG